MADPYNTKNYTEQGGERTAIGGSLDVVSGGDLDIESGGALKIAGTQVTASAAELNTVDITAAGTAQASKALVADANKDLAGVRNLTLGTNGVGGAAGSLILKDGANPGASSALDYTDAVFVNAITASAAELNSADGAPLSGASLFTVGIEGGDAINVAIQLKDLPGADLAVRGALYAYLSNDANGDSLATVAPSGGVAIGTDGLLIPVTPALTNAVLVHGNLAVDAVPEKFKTTQASAFLINGVSHVLAATTAIVFSAAHAITASKFGVVLVQVNAAGTVSTKVPGSPQAYNDAPTALAALPAPDAGNVVLGHIAIANDAGDWTANTDSMTDDVTSAAFTDATETAIGGAKAFTLVSEADGDIDINVNEAGVATWYLVLVLPNGKLVASGAITFA